MLLEVVQDNLFGIVLSSEAKATIVGLLLIAIALLVLWKLRHFIVNSALGLVALLFLKWITGIDVSINILTVIVAGVLGLAGVGLMVLLTVLGFTF